jgi:hypothetical protein
MREMSTQILFQTSNDSRHAVLSIDSSTPITVPEMIEHVEEWLRDMKGQYAQEILKRQELFESGRLVPFFKGVKKNVDRQDRTKK